MNRPLRVGDRVARASLGTVVTSGVGVDAPAVEVAWETATREIVWEFVSDLTRVEPTEPPVGSVVVKDGLAYTRFTDSDVRCWDHYMQPEYATWGDISDGKIIFIPGGDA
jgi:hypothetical protein